MASAVDTANAQREEKIEEGDYKGLSTTERRRRQTLWKQKYGSTIATRVLPLQLTALGERVLDGGRVFQVLGELAQLLRIVASLAYVDALKAGYSVALTSDAMRDWFRVVAQAVYRPELVAPKTGISRHAKAEDVPDTAGMASHSQMKAPIRGILAGWRTRPERQAAVEGALKRLRELLLMTAGRAEDHALKSIAGTESDRFLAQLQLHTKEVVVEHAVEYLRERLVAELTGVVPLVALIYLGDGTDLSRCITSGAWALAEERVVSGGAVDCAALVVRVRATSRDPMGHRFRSRWAHSRLRQRWQH